jgi:hypothetical protein
LQSRLNTSYEPYKIQKRGFDKSNFSIKLFGLEDTSVKYPDCMFYFIYLLFSPPEGPPEGRLEMYQG